MSEATSVKRARRTLAVGFFTVATVAALVAPTWLALRDTTDSTRAVGRGAVPESSARATIGSPAASPESSAPLSRSAVTVKSDLATASWHSLPAAPVPARDDAAVGWTGTEMVVWGGASGSQGDTLRSDGAAFDPATKAWTTLPASPLSSREDPAAVWTGHDLFVWGGDVRLGNAPKAANDGALYDPSTGRWQLLPPSPLSARTGAQALELDGLVYVIGGQPAVATSDQRADTDAATFDPASNRWRLLPDAPTTAGRQVMYETGVATDHTIELFEAWQQVSPNGQDMTAGIEASSYSPTAEKWTDQPGAAIGTSYPNRPSGLDGVLWSGRQLVLPASQLWCGDCPAPFQTGTHGWTFDLNTNTWTPIPHGPVDDDSATYLWTSSGLLAYDTNAYTSGPDGEQLPGLIAVWSPTSKTWTPLPAAPLAGSGVSVWTGTELIEWGAMFVPAQAGESAAPVIHDAAIAFGP